MGYCNYLFFVFLLFLLLLFLFQNTVYCDNRGINNNNENNSNNNNENDNNNEISISDNITKINDNLNISNNNENTFVINNQVNIKITNSNTNIPITNSNTDAPITNSQSFGTSKSKTGAPSNINRPSDSSSKVNKGSFITYVCFKIINNKFFECPMGFQNHPRYAFLFLEENDKFFIAMHHAPTVLECKINIDGIWLCYLYITLVQSYNNSTATVIFGVCDLNIKNCNNVFLPLVFGLKYIYSERNWKEPVIEYKIGGCENTILVKCQGGTVCNQNITTPGEFMPNFDEINNMYMKYKDPYINFSEDTQYISDDAFN